MSRRKKLHLVNFLHGNELPNMPEGAVLLFHRRLLPSSIDFADFSSLGGLQP